MQNDLTKGNIYKKIIVFTIPILLSNVLQQLYSIADNTIVGRILGKDALAAVGASYQISSIILAVAMGLTLGMGILISRAYGAKQKDKIQKIVDTGVVLCMILATVITMIGLCCAERILILFQVPNNILEQATLYFRIICLGTIPSFGYNAIVNYLQGIGDSRTSLIFLAVSAVMNIVLDIFFIATIGAGVAGAAIATILSQIVEFVSLCIYVNRKLYLKYGLFKIRFIYASFDCEILKQGLSIGIPAILQQLFIGVGNSVIQYMINGYGETIIAAYTAASKIDGLAVLPAINIGKAMSNFIAQNKGANSEERVKAGTKASIIIVAVISVLFSVFIFTISNLLLKLFCTDKEVCMEGVKYLQAVSVFYLFFGIMQCLNGILLGMGKSNLSLIGSMLSFCAFQVPLAIVLSRFIGVVGIWLAAPLGWIAGMVIRLIFIWKSSRHTDNIPFSHHL